MFKFNILTFVPIADACLGGELGNPESFIKAILDTQNLAEYPKQVVDFYILNVSNSVLYDASILTL